MSSDDNLRDELEIRNLVARYADAVNRHAEADWAATWAEDGVWKMLGNTIEGRDAIVNMWRGAMGFFSFVIQLIYSGTVEIDGDTARGRFYLSEMGHTSKGDRLLTLAVYHDELRKQNGRWLFTRRQFEPLYQGPPDLTGQVIPYQEPSGD